MIIKVDNIMDDVLERSGIENLTEYLMADKKDLNNPKSMRRMERAIKLVREGRNFMILVDQDSDGFTSSSKMARMLNREGRNNTYFIHDGKKHGITKEFIAALDDTIDTIIIPDAGSNQIEEIRELSQKYSVVILDHHIYNIELANELMEERSNVAIVNCQDGSYNNPKLAGVGVVQKFAELYDEIVGTDHSKRDLDLVAMGNVADSMPVNIMENKAYITLGAEVENDLLKTIIKERAYNLGNKTTLTPMRVGWTIAPMLNALIRVGTVEEKELLYLSLVGEVKEVPSKKRGNEGNMVSIHQEVYRLMSNARNRQNKLVESFMNVLDEFIITDEESEVMIYAIPAELAEAYPNSVNGLTAMKKAQSKMKPSLVLRISDGVARGSGRNIDGHPIPSLRNYLLKSKCFDFVEGHDNAFGVCIDLDRMDELNFYLKTEKDFGEDNRVEYMVEKYQYDQLPKIAMMDEHWGKGMDNPSLILDLDFDFRELKNNTMKWEFFAQGQKISIMKFKASNELMKKCKEPNVSYRLTVKMQTGEYRGVKQYTGIVQKVEVLKKEKEWSIHDF